jgi:hypothetical protein
LPSVFCDLTVADNSGGYKLKFRAIRSSSHYKFCG